jgi:hypothetical protein
VSSSPTFDQLNAMLDEALAAAGGRRYGAPQATAAAVAAPSYANANSPAREGRDVAATALFRGVFNAAANAGGHAGTAASAGDRDRRIASAVKNPR